MFESCDIIKCLMIKSVVRRGGEESFCQCFQAIQAWVAFYCRDREHLPQHVIEGLFAASPESERSMKRAGCSAPGCASLGA